MPRKPKNYGQKSLPNLDAQIEAETEGKKGRPLNRGMPVLAEIQAYAAEIGLTGEDGEHIHDIWLTNGFRLKTGLKIHDFRAAMRIWKRNGFFPSQKKAAAATKELEEREARQRAAIRRFKEK
jgi:hypothetical protein